MITKDITKNQNIHADIISSELQFAIVLVVPTDDEYGNTYFHEEFYVEDVTGEKILSTTELFAATTWKDFSQAQNELAYIKLHDGYTSRMDAKIVSIHKLSQVFYSIVS